MCWLEKTVHNQKHFTSSVLAHTVGLHNNVGHASQLRHFVVISWELFIFKTLVLYKERIFKDIRDKRKSGIKAVKDAGGEKKEKIKRRDVYKWAAEQLSSLVVRLGTSRCTQKLVFCEELIHTHKHTWPDVKATEKINFSWQTETFCWRSWWKVVTSMSLTQFQTTNRCSYCSSVTRSLSCCLFFFSQTKLLCEKRDD